MLYGMIKEKRREPRNKQQIMRDSRGGLTKEPEELKKRWKEHFRDLLNSKRPEIIEPNRQEEEEEREEEKEDEYITLAEVCQAIKRMKNGKAPGADGLTVEMIKAAGQCGSTWLLRVINAAWKQKRVPEEWVRGEIVPLFKKGDRKECRNYRGVTLMSHAAKIYERVLDTRVRAKVEPGLREEQYGFRAGRSTIELIFALRQLMEARWEDAKPMCITFLDLEKAYDHLPRSIVWECLSRREVGKDMIDRIKSTYKNCESRVQTTAGVTPWFSVNSGVRQGSVLSPLLFALVMDEIMKKVDSEGDATTSRTMIYADDILIWGEDNIEVQEKIDRWSMITEDYGMKISKEKSESLLMYRGRRPKWNKIKLGGIELQEKEEFKYLGSIVTKDGKCDIEVRKRITQAEGFYQSVRKLLWNEDFPIQCKVLLYKMYYIPILTYGSVTWTMGWKEESQMQAAEMKFIRSMAGISKIEKKRSKDIRKKCGLERLQYKIGRERLRWYGHMMRMDSERIPKMIFENAEKRGEKRRVGRPRERWQSQIQRNAEERGVEWIKIKEEKWWESRKMWKTFVDQPEGEESEEDEENVVL